MANVAPVAADAGVSVEETTALLGLLADRGLDASTAGTSLRNNKFIGQIFRSR